MFKIEKIVITAEILSLISQIDEFRGKWLATQDLVPDRLNSLKRIATIESIGSSTRIEGARLSNLEVERLLSKLEQKSFASRDEQEVAGYADAMDVVFESFQHISLTENHIKQLHGVLLKFSTKDEDHRGEYKKISNHVEAFDASGLSIGVVFETASPMETPNMMRDLVEWYNHQVNENALHPLLLIGVFITVFLAIHPFRDGNGRLSGILTTLLLLRSGYSYVPYSSMETVIEENKEAYYLALRRTQQTIHSENQNWEPWLVFFLRTMLKQKENLSNKLKEERFLRDTLPALSRDILEMVQTRGEVTVREIEAVTKANRNTIKAHLTRLTAQEYLVKAGKGRGVRYFVKK
ncbi:MAG TPA: Fic family protein [Oligoflexia bacterium]|nr:Fic family protein [Oligoflexia bacterium]HMP49020.1 Fic family protein [Oligoflexia bacterium]